MESVSASFEKYINEIQFLKKQVSGEKLSHENTLRQLQSSYQIIDEMKDALRLEQTNSIKLKNEFTQTTSKLVAVSRQYEEQISEIKDMITLKDEELRRINSFLMVNDADVIRLKVINEVQLTHKDQLQCLHIDIARKNAEINEIRSNCILLSNKNEYLSKQLKGEQEAHREEVEELNNKYIDELKNTYERLEKQRQLHSKWAKKYEILQKRLNKQIEFYKEEIHKLNLELRTENSSLLSNSDAKAGKHKIEKLQEAISKLKEEVVNEKQFNAKLEDEIVSLRKESKILKKNEQDSKIEKERLMDEIQKLKEQISLRESQNKRSIDAISKQLEEKSDMSSILVKDGKERQERLEIQQKRLKYKLQEVQLENNALKQQSIDKNIAALKREIRSQQEEITSLKEEIKLLKKKQGEKKRILNTNDRREDNLSQLKEKLQEANSKIVELLKEKIELKKEIATIRSQ